MTLTIPRLMTACLLSALFFSGCVRQSVFRSPYTNLQNSYHVMPLLSDSSRSNNYLSLASSHGFANDNWSDGISIGQLKWHHARSFGRFQAFFGAHAHAGFYRINPNSYYSDQYGSPFLDSLNYFNGPTGRKFTGSVGLNGGFTYTIPLGTRVEWRVLGVEVSGGREFGDYLNIRKGLPDSAVTYVEKRNTPVTIGGFTEWIFKPSNPRYRFGYQLAIGSSAHRMLQSDYGYNIITPVYVNNSFHFTIDRYTGYVQARLGDFFGAVQLGWSVRL